METVLLFDFLLEVVPAKDMYFSVEKKVTRDLLKSAGKRAW